MAKVEKEKIKKYKELGDRYDENYNFNYIAQPLSIALNNLAIEIKRMDKLDNTNDFSNLLSDVEDE